MLRRALATLAAAFAIVAGSLVAAAPADASDGLYCVGETCWVTLSAPPSDPSSAADGNGWTPGASTCYVRVAAETAADYPDDQLVVYAAGTVPQWYITIPCGNGERYWSNTRQCFVSMFAGEWPERPSYVNQDAGYYVCAPHPDHPSTLTSYFWSNTVPPGLQVLTPGAAAAQLIATFQLEPIAIGIAPKVNPEWGHRRTYVGVPVWLWAVEPGALSWGPYSETATLGGQTITATAKVSAVRWGMGDGGEVVCGSPGTPYTYSDEIRPSPTCGYTYLKTSSSQPGDRFTITATSQWVVTWESTSGATGAVNLTVSSSDEIEVNELQSVIVPNPPSNGDDD